MSRAAGLGRNRELRRLRARRSDTIGAGKDRGGFTVVTGNEMNEGERGFDVRVEVGNVDKNDGTE
jgi:hypothetical protein